MPPGKMEAARAEFASNPEGQSALTSSIQSAILMSLQVFCKRQGQGLCRKSNEIIKLF